MNLNGKVVLISGANSGIGFAACLLFAKEKSTIIALDIAENINDDLRLKLSSLGAAFTYFSVDVSKSQDVFSIIEKIDKIDVLINNAGILGPNQKTLNYPLEDFDRVIDVNIKGVYYLMKAVLQKFSIQKSGVIVNTASVAGHLGMVGHIAYAASKHAVVGMTKTVAIEYAKSGIRVNAVCPGFTQTPMLESAETDGDYMNMLKMATPMRRFGEPFEIASAILFLASDASSFITGQSIILDGGLSAQ